MDLRDFIICPKCRGRLDYMPRYDAKFCTNCRNAYFGRDVMDNDFKPRAKATIASLVGEEDLVINKEGL